MRKFTLSLGMFIFALCISVTAVGAPLKVVDADAPNINCLFTSPCTNLVSHASGDAIPLGTGGVNTVLTRTFSGQPGTPAASLTAYVYQISMAEAINVGVETCVTSMSMNFGHVINAFDYDNDGTTGDEVFVIHSGGTGSIGISSADKVADNIKFTFAEPICAGNPSNAGGSSLLFGMISTQEPHTTTASVRGAPVFIDYSVEIRTPMIETFSMLTLEYFDTDADRLLSDSEFFAAIDMWLTQSTIPGTETQIDDLTFFRLIDWWVGGSPIIFDHEPFAASDVKLNVANNRFNVAAQGENVRQIEVDLFSTAGERVLSQTGVGKRLSFRALSTTGQPLANGVYFAQITTRDAVGSEIGREVRKIAVVR